jgi:outer membrane biosynthesis protein TonB
VANKKQNDSPMPELVVESNDAALARYEQPTKELALTPVFDLAEAKKRMLELQGFVREYLIPEEDYGIIPGTKKPTLLKSGADKLCDVYGLADEYELTSRTEDWSQNLFDFEIKCTLLSKRTGNLVGTGMGSCSSFESKYRYREAKRRCPTCGKETVIKGREDYGGGWLCWKKEGKSDGCGAKFAAGDVAITNQKVGRVENEDLADQKNTILKMAKKRAKIDAVLSVTRSSGLFTQDLDDSREPLPYEPATVETTPKPQAAKPRPAPAKPTPPPKANIPVDTPTKPPVPKETEVIKPAGVPKSATPAKPAAPKSRTERGRDIANKTGCSTTNLTSFIGRTLGVNNAEQFKQVPIPRFEAVIWGLEQTLNEFPPASVKSLICDEAKIPPSVKSYFNMAFAKADNTKETGQ